MNFKDKNIEKICEYVDISINKNSLFGDTYPLNPVGIRLGTVALTTRGMKEEDFIKIGKLVLRIQEEHGKPLKKFEAALDSYKELDEIRNEVNNFAGEFNFPCEEI